jgi:hypothetical protein
MSRHTGSPRHRLDGPHIAVVQQDDAAGLGVLAQLGRVPFHGMPVPVVDVTGPHDRGQTLVAGSDVVGVFLIGTATEAVTDHLFVRADDGAGPSRHRES